MSPSVPPAACICSTSNLRRAPASGRFHLEHFATASSPHRDLQGRSDQVDHALANSLVNASESLRDVGSYGDALAAAIEASTSVGGPTRQTPITEGRRSHTV
jgi:hypothetical protein